jgi:hypothetical protein
MRKDVLAAQAVRASFGPANVSQEKWESIFAPDAAKKAKVIPFPVKRKRPAKRKSECRS